MKEKKEELNPVKKWKKVVEKIPEEKRGPQGTYKHRYREKLTYMKDNERRKLLKEKTSSKCVKHSITKSQKQWKRHVYKRGSRIDFKK